MFYLIETIYTGPNDRYIVDEDTVEVTTVVPRTNSSKEERPFGWLGTTDILDGLIMKSFIFAVATFVFSAGVNASYCEFVSGMVVDSQDYAHCLTWHGVGVATVGDMVVSYHTTDESLLKTKVILDEMAEEEGLYIEGDFYDYLTELRESL